MKIKFLSLGSGSSGNCYYLGTDNYAILIDAGIGIRSIKKTFKDFALNLDKVRAVFVTHDHADHIKAVGHLAGKHNIPIYATPEVHKGINKSYCMTEKLDGQHTRYIHKEETIQIEDFSITCFEVPHDGTDNVGYSVDIDGKNFTFLTDIGHITETAARYIAKANYLILEANYDEAMLQMGPYPQHLKARIAGPNGHMCTRDMAEHLADHFPPALKHLWLCHLSKDNNHPELALKTVEMILRDRNILPGKDVEITALKRTIPTGIYEFD
ncbi:MBL fold metallo-hydrolase [uncultured Bacteroides sp.]|uniref:MBL fold metallo-hydrolase n=1 Tax=uncultured Bacteroides sp. TaxID=162156 RepID=UPI002624E811|nr:MBL fold metallo-hydrolase [uncultured Bacteroides sp.]